MNDFEKELDELLTATAWEMTPPPAYGAFHLTFTFIGIALCVGLAFLLRNADDRVNRIVLVSAGVFLMLTEVYKQLFYYFVKEEQAYNFGIFPFQLCSVPMYLCVIVPFLPAGRLRDGMYHFMTTFNLLGGFMAFIEPSGITHNYWGLTLHAYIWHMSLIFIGFYLIASRRGATEWAHYRSACVTFLVLCVVAFAINCALWEVSEGGINMFFVGPRNSSLIVFKQISEMFGWYISTLLYIPVVCLGALIVFYPVRRYHLCKQKKHAKTETEAIKEPTPVGK